jgi:hypothetical protein
MTFLEWLQEISAPLLGVLCIAVLAGPVVIGVAVLGWGATKSVYRAWKNCARRKPAST